MEGALHLYHRAESSRHGIPVDRPAFRGARLSVVRRHEPSGARAVRSASDHQWSRQVRAAHGWTWRRLGSARRSGSRVLERRFGAVLDAELFEEMLDVKLDRVLRKPQTLGDLGIRESLRDQRPNL